VGIQQRRGLFGAQETMKKKEFPYVAFLPLGKSAGLPVLPDKLGAAEVLDPFAPDVTDRPYGRWSKRRGRQISAFMTCC
jgi:hypothetical protein